MLLYFVIFKNIIHLRIMNLLTMYYELLTKHKKYQNVYICETIYTTWSRKQQLSLDRNTVDL